MYFKSRKELDYNRFVDPNLLGVSRLVHSDLRIYRISFLLLDRAPKVKASVHVVAETVDIRREFGKPHASAISSHTAQWFSL